MSMLGLPQVACPVPGCVRTFVSAPALQTHIATHRRKAEPTYPCTEELCGRVFETSYGLQVHMGEAHGVLTEIAEHTFTCSICNAHALRIHKATTDSRASRASQ